MQPNTASAQLQQALEQRDRAKEENERLCKVVDVLVATTNKNAEVILKLEREALNSNIQAVALVSSPRSSCYVTLIACTVQVCRAQC